MPKVCRDCGLSKPPWCFYAKPDARDKLSPYCKDCQKRRSAESRARRELRYVEAAVTRLRWDLDTWGKRK